MIWQNSRELHPAAALLVPPGARQVSDLSLEVTERWLKERAGALGSTLPKVFRGLALGHLLREGGREILTLFAN